jgi:putative ABC transport system substrate-binding protein
MKRREFISLLCGATAWPLTAHAQRRRDQRLIAVLMSSSDHVEGKSKSALFEDALKGLGWVSGENVRIEYRRGAINRSLIRSFVAELVNLQPDVILGDSTPIVIGLRRQTKTIPIVFVQISDPLGSRLVSSLARPAGNVTGFTDFEFSMGAKWIEILKEINPNVGGVSVFFNAKTAPYAVQYVRAIKQVARSTDIVIYAEPVSDPTDVEYVVDDTPKINNAFIVLPDLFTGIHHKLIVSCIAKHGSPAVFPFPCFATSGGLLSYGVDQLDLFRRSAAYVDRILKGDNPANLPVQQPHKFRMVINLKTAKSQTITLPATLLARADDLVE